MKILFHTPSGTLRQYPRQDAEPVVGLDPDFQIFDLIQHPQPEYDAATHYLEATEEIEVPQARVVRGWIIHAIEPSPPGWLNVQAFMEAFTMQEKAGVSLSNDGIIAALRLTLSTWLGRVEISDERVQLGLNRMVELGLITEARKAEIETLAS